MNTNRQLNFGLFGRVVSAGLAVFLVIGTADAAGLTSRSDTLNTSQAGAVTTHGLAFTTATGSAIGSIGFDFCTTADGSCTVPTGLATTSATLSAQTGISGFTLVNSTNGAPYIKNTGTPTVNGSTAVTVTLANITDPSAINTTFFVRITTYTGTDGATGPVDTGNVTASTAQPIQLTGVTPEILIFCVGTTMTGDCTTVSGSSVDFGDFDPLSTKTGTSVMQASTNAGGGYNVTVNGTTLESGANSITALAAQTAAATGSAQFGLNLRANTTPAVGADPTGGSGAIGTYSANYGTANQYRFNTGDTVAMAVGPTNANTFTSSYIVNIPSLQAAGTYTATMTYICTANF
jgi:hypothetical protein